MIHMLISVTYVSCDFQCMPTCKWYLSLVDNIYKIIFKLFTLSSKKTHTKKRQGKKRKDTEKKNAIFYFDIKISKPH